ncbi:MFS transporter [Agromyces seonyuensis]|uniref:MFS transporter n=1 Tax=Agromyces seonyuensis TaxID=2662446 RepID=A0A6I4P1P2_9MICO|nr:MFS transporter [Agromyces seonyuensis]MWB97147.1 MFS transporter [Agromyces seonyuensis]
MNDTRAARTAGGGAVGLLVAAELGSGLVQGWYSPLLTSIGEKYGVGAALLNLVAVAYLLSSVLFVPLLTKLADRHGHKKLLLVAIGITAVGSLVVAFAPNFGVLLAGRVLQGALVTFLPLEFAIVRQRSPELVGKSIGQLIASLAIGAIVGTLASGALFGATGSLELTLSVPAIYLAACLVLIAIVVPETTIRSAGRIDWAGVFLLGLGAAGLLGGISLAAGSGWGNLTAWGLIAAGVVILAVWVIVERRIPDPFIDLSLLTGGGIGLPVVIGSVFAMQALGAGSLAAIYVRIDPAEYGFGLGLSAAQAGLALGAMGLMGFVGSAFGDRLARAITPRGAMLLASLLSALSYALMILVPGVTALFIVWVAIGGFGMGAMISVLPAIVVNRAAPDAVATVSGLYNTARTAAGAVAGALFSTVLAAFVIDGSGAEGTAPVTSFAGYATVWGVCIGLCLISAALVLRLPRETKPATAESSEAAEELAAEAV